MPGSSYGDFSRAPLGGRFRSVWAQQGRVQLDADWNAEVALVADGLASGLADVLGPAAAPAHAAGFALRPIVALGFDGRGHLDVHDAAALAFGVDDAFCLECWVRPEATAGTLVELSGEDDAGVPTGYRLSLTQRGELAFAQGAATLYGVRWQEVVAQVPVAVGVFVHVAAVVEPGALRLYCDQVLVAEAGIDARAEVRHARLRLGASSSRSAPALGRAPGFVGELGATRLWCRALSAEELAIWSTAAPSEAAVESLVVEEHLAAWWPLDEGRGRHVRDLVGRHRAHCSGEVPPAWHLVDLEISPGRFYIHGAACALERPARYLDQPGLSDLDVPSDPGRYLAYLEAFDRSIFAIEDPAIGEVALGGLDTTVRSATAATVHLWRVPDRVPDPLAEDRGVLARLLASLSTTTTGTMAARHDGESPVENLLYRIEVHRSGCLGGESGSSLPAEALAGAGRGEGEAAVASIAADAGSSRARSSRSDAEAIADLFGGLDTDVRSERDAAAAPGTPPPVLRVGPTVKWSRTNGSAMVPVAPVEPNSTTLRILPGPGQQNLLRAEDLVELVDERVSRSGVPQPLLRVRSVTPSEVVVDPAPPPGVGADRGARPFLRRWDQAGVGPGSDQGALVVEAGRPLALENGIEVRFGPGSYRAGDYWWVTARHDLGGIEWPQHQGRPLALGPSGVERRRALLALVVLEAGEVRVHDLRAIAHPLARAPERVDERPPEPPMALDDAPPTPSGKELGEQGEVRGEPAGGREGRAGDREGERFEPRPQPAGEPEGSRPIGALVAPAGARLRDFVSTGLQVLVRARWERLGPLAGLRGELEALSGEGGQLIVGSDAGIWRFTPGARRLELVAPLPEARRGGSLLVDGRVVYLVGGSLGARGSSASLSRRPDGALWSFALEDGTWSRRCPMPRPVAAPAVAVAGGRLHCCGGARRRGWWQVASRSHQVYDLERDLWQEAPELPEPRIAGAAAGVGGRLHLVGGSGRWFLGRHALGSHVVFERGGWTSAAPLPPAWRGARRATRYGDGVAVVANEVVAQVPPIIVFDASAPGFADASAKAAKSAAEGAWAPLPALPDPACEVLVGTDERGLCALASLGRGEATALSLAQPVDYELYRPRGEEG